MKESVTRGVFLVLVGPDGVGKTTVAANVIKASGGAGRYFHFRPPLRGWSDPEPGQFTSPDGRSLNPGGTSFLRLLANLGRFWGAYLLRIAPAVRAGKLVIGDRWIYGYLIEPRSMRYSGSERLARLAVRLAPQPDVVVGLTAPAEVITSRKAELDHDAIALQLDRIRRLPVRRLEMVSASGERERVAASVLEAATRSRRM